MTGPRTVSLHEAMQASQALARLEQRIQASRSRFDVVRVTLPAQLLQGVKPGPWDETGWTLFVPNGATAAKLRQWLPKLEQALVTGGFERIAIRIRIQANT